MGKARLCPSCSTDGGVGLLSIRLDEDAVIAYNRRAWQYFITTQQYYKWKEKN